MTRWTHSPGRLQGLHLFERPVFGDPRGYFSELWHQARYEEAGLTTAFVQDNYSRSAQHILRGLHFQVNQPQSKLVTCVQGEIWDVAVDLRKDSPTYGEWEAATLSEENGKQIFIPGGFAHGFLVLSETASVLYKCDRHYDAQDDFGIRWDDPQLAIAWPTSAPPILSDKDASLPLLADAPHPFL